MEPTWKMLLPELIDRHRVIDISRFPWFRVPAQVKIAIYAEGSIRFDGGSFDGLKRVIATLNADPWPWVEFEITLIHRGTDPSAAIQNKRLDEIGLKDFDELWLFGASGGNLLSDAEIAAVEAFMNAGGGVLHTGDHASLGQGIAGSIKRVGAMRKYPAPEAQMGVWNNTLRSGADGNYSFNDQSDETPQTIRLRYYHQWRVWPSFAQRKFPHPLMCGSSGPITVFPDHQHEGEAIEPAAYPVADWPEKDGFQPKVEVIAWGRIEAPDADQGREVGLVSVYDGHRVGVGRIAADSTWHHWFDINLDGFAATPTGTVHLSKIEEYFLNVAAWLAPKFKQSQMRNGLFRFGLWRDPLVMLDPTKFPIYLLGGIARDALGQFAPQCMINQWLIDIIPPPLLRLRCVTPPIPEPEPKLPFPLPIQDILVGSIVEPLMRRNKQVDGPEEGADDRDVEQAIAKAIPRAGEFVRAQIEELKQLEEVASVLLNK